MEPKKRKTEDDGLQYFRNFLSDEKNKTTISLLRVTLPDFASGYGQYNLALLRVKAANANSFACFGKATIDTELYRVDSGAAHGGHCSVAVGLRLFYMRGYCTLRDFLDESDPKIPENLAERGALKDLLQFLANAGNNLKVVVEKQGNTESEAASAQRFAQHLLIPLVPHKTFVIDSCSGLQFSKCCPVEHHMNGRKGDTSFGCPNGWHGRADILLMDCDVPLTVLETEGKDDDASSVTSDSSVEVKKCENFSADSISQVIAQTIVSSFLQQKKHPSASCSLTPGIGICSGKLIVYLYDCVEDILLTTGLTELFVSSPSVVNYRAVIILWLVLNHSLFGNKFPERYKNYPASFHKVLDPEQLEMYKHESQHPFTARYQEEDTLHWLNEERVPPFLEHDLATFTEEMENQFPGRQGVPL